MLDEVESPNLQLDFTFDTPPSSFAQQPINDSITLPIASLNINTSQEKSLGNIINKYYLTDTEEINYKNFKDNILQDLRKDIEEMRNRKTKSVEKTSKASIESCSLNYVEQINILRNELNSKNLTVNKLLETVDKFTNQSSLHSEIQPMRQYNLENAGKSSNDVEDNITVSSIIYHERNSLLDRVTETTTFERNNHQQKGKHSVSEHKSIEKQLNELNIKKETGVL